MKIKYIKEGYFKDINKIKADADKKVSVRDSYGKMQIKYKIDIKGIHNKLLQAFQLFEFEKKGFVNSKSIQSLLSNDKISDKDINQIIREANPDSNGYINIEEFANELIGNDSYNNNTINKVITTSMSNTIET